MMKVLLQIGLLVLLAFVGFAGGGAVGAQFVPEGSGLAGGATVFLWAAGGFVSAIVGGSVAVSRLSMRAQRFLFMAAAALTLAILAWVGARIARQSAEVDAPASGVRLRAAIDVGLGRATR